MWVYKPGNPSKWFKVETGFNLEDISFPSEKAAFLAVQEIEKECHTADSDFLRFDENTVLDMSHLDIWPMERTAN